MAKSGKGRQLNHTSKQHINSDEPLADDSLKKLVGVQIKRVRQGYFNEAQEKIGAQVFKYYGQNIMFRLEQGNGSVINILRLLKFFHQHGVNLNFLFEDNENESEMVQYNASAHDPAFTKSIIDKYESAMTNLYKLKDLNAIAIDKNINDMRAHIESISKLTTIESIELEKK